MKLNKIMSFLSKKGVLLFGIVVGFLIAVFSSIIVNAEESTGDVLGRTLIDADCLYAKSSTNTVHYGQSIRCNSMTNPLKSSCYFVASGATVNGFACDKITVFFDGTYGYYVTRDGTTTYSEDTHWVSDSSVETFNSSIYEFSSAAECQAYLNGEIDASSALNYDEINFGVNSDWSCVDSSIPVPVDAYISTINDRQVVTNLKYDEMEVAAYLNEHEIEKLSCEVETEFLYQYLTGMQIKNKTCNPDFNIHNVNSATSGNVSEYGLIVSDVTCGELYDIIKTTNNIEFYTKVCHADNGSNVQNFDVQTSFNCSSVPPDYSELYSQDFSLTSFEYHMTFICAQVKIRTYYINPSGEKIYSDDVYVRRFVYDKANDTYGSTFTRITNDTDGSSSFVSSFDQDANGNNITFTSGVISGDNLLEYIQNGYILAGEDGYLGLLQQTLLGVPVWIWTLVGSAMAVNIAVIVFKALRGM